MKTIEGFHKTRRKLPHWQDAGSTYFLTWRVMPGLELPPSSRDAAMSAVRCWDAKTWKVFAAVVMPDHVHVLAEVLPVSAQNPGVCHDLSEILKSTKGFSSRQINKLQDRQGHFWQDETFDRIVRSEREFHEYWNYIQGNPVKKGLAEAPADYIWLYEDTG